MRTNEANWLEERAARGSFSARLVLALRRRAPLAVATFVLSFGFFLAVIAFLPRKYSAEMKLLVNRQRSTLVVTPGAASAQASDQPDGDESEINSEIQLMESQGLLSQVVRETEPLKGSAQGADRATERAVNQLRKNLQIDPVRKSDVINVTLIDRSPEHGLQVLRAFLADYLQAHLAAHDTSRTYAFFMDQAAGYRDKLDQAERELAKYQGDEQIVDLPQQEDLLTRARGDSLAQMYAAQAAMEADRESLKAARGNLASASAEIPTQSRSVPNQYSIQSMRTTLLELENRRTDLLTNFLPTDRQVQDVSGQIENTRKSLNEAESDASVEKTIGVNPVRQTVEGDINRLTIQLAADAARSSSLAGEVAKYDMQLTHLISVEQRYGQLQMQQKELADSYGLYVSKREEAHVSMALDTEKFANVSVIEAPLEHYLPFSPSVALDVVVGFALALCLALAAALLRDYFGRSSLEGRPRSPGISSLESAERTL